MNKAGTRISITLLSDRPVAIMAKLERYDGDDVSFGSATSLSLSFILQRRHRRRPRRPRKVVYICPQISKHPMNGTGISWLARRSSSNVDLEWECVLQRQVRLNANTFWEKIITV